MVTSRSTLHRDDSNTGEISTDVQAEGGESSIENIELQVVAFIEVSLEDPVAAAGPVTEAVRIGGGRLVQVVHRLVIASFDSASTAVETCAALPGVIRGGLSCGDVLRQKGLMYGVPVVEASRLKDFATPGQVLCTKRLMNLVGTSRVAAREIGALSLKGFAAPVFAYEIVRERIT